MTGKPLGKVIDADALEPVVVEAVAVAVATAPGEFVAVAAGSHAASTSRIARDATRTVQSSI
jgi:hypothetical protein